MFVFKAAVVGAGTMGGQIAQTIAASGIPVVLKDISDDLVQTGIEEARNVTQGQTVDVEDEKISGTQRVSFAPAEDAVVVTLELDYRLKQARPGMALVDLLFIRRPQRESLQRTLRRFRAEVTAEREGSV